MMDREIKFRAKTDRNREWIYGGIVHQTDFYGEKVDRWYIIDGEDTRDYDIGYNYLVDRQTIGQYTGLKDKNGVEIYEGDIIRQEFEEYTGTVGYVYFEKGAFKITNLYDDDGYNELSAWAEHTVNGKQRIEVIGNIYDNPELLEATE